MLTEILNIEGGQKESHRWDHIKKTVEIKWIVCNHFLAVER